MRPGRRRILVAVAVLLPALLVYGARQVGSPVAAGDLPVGTQPVFVGRMLASSHGSVGRPVKVTVDIRADRQVDLAGIRVWTEDGPPDEITPFRVGPEPRTAEFELTFAGSGDHTLVLQVRLAGEQDWQGLPPTTRVIVA